MTQSKWIRKQEEERKNNYSTIFKKHPLLLANDNVMRPVTQSEGK